MTEEVFTKRLIELLNEFHKEKETHYVSGTAKEIVHEWCSIQDMNDAIDEVRSDYTDDEGAVVIDVWTRNNEEGFSVARVLPDNTVEWTRPSYKDCSKITEEIQAVKASCSFIGY